MDTRTVYCKGCEQAEYRHIIMEARSEGASPAEVQAHLDEYVRLIICDDCEQYL